MESKQTKSCSIIFKLEGGTKENDLHGYRTLDTNNNIVSCGVFTPNEEERIEIANGARIVVAIWGKTVPPMNVIIIHDEDVESEIKQTPSLASSCFNKNGCTKPAECATHARCTYKG
jgi:hypothetical protein